MTAEHKSDSPEYRLFSVEEANALIPELERYFIITKKLIAKLDNVVQKKKKESEGNGNIEWNPRSNLPVGMEFIPKTLKYTSKLSDKLRDKGVIIRGGNSWLADFPHLRDGKVVFLCWQLGEKKIGFWHEIDAGKAGRKPL